VRRFRPSTAAVLAISIAVAGSLVFAAAGCGRTGDSTPPACLSGSGAYMRALEGAPGAVTLAGGVPISDCLAENQQAGDLASVGDAMLGAATELNSDARAEPGGAANLRLGYLIGAAQNGAEGTDGIHTELIRRLIAAATYSPGQQVLGKEFERTYREGFEAGLAGG
jgi:hypothetical protein